MKAGDDLNLTRKAIRFLLWVALLAGMALAGARLSVVLAAPGEAPPKVEAASQPAEPDAPLGSVIYVDRDATGLNNGATWANAYRSLQSALTAAASGTEIWVAEGVYTPTLRTDSGDPRSVTFQLKNGVAIYGGFSGIETLREQRDWQIHISTLSGDLNSDDVGFSNNGENAYHVLTGSGRNLTAIIDGFTITGGNANYGSVYPHHSGGGMVNVNGSPWVENVVFDGNAAYVQGGGIYNFQSHPRLTNVYFMDNFSSMYGGGLYNHGSNPVLVDVVFKGNSADVGGGIGSWASSPLLVNGQFIGNSASSGAGMDNVGGGSPKVVNTIFISNVGNSGGGMRNNGTNTSLVNVTFIANSASFGGGMGNENSSPIIANAIFWGNSGGQISNTGTGLPTVCYSLVQGGYAGTGNIDADPMFIDADGPDNLPGTLDDNLRLWSNSPAVDAGDNSALPADMLDLDEDGITGTETLPLDLGYKPRQVDMPLKTDSGSGTPPIVDMGAYEARVIYVDQSATAGEDQGVSWQDAFLDLHEALVEATTNNEIWVAQGAYLPDQKSGERQATFQLLSGVALYGGFPTGGGDGSFGGRDWDAYPAILSGDIGKKGDNSDNSYHVVTGSGADATAILDGFTISGGNAAAAGGYLHGGNAPQAAYENYGGGMFNDAGSPRVVNCRFNGNLSAIFGAGMANVEHSEPSVANCVFSGNASQGHGGGIYNQGSDPSIRQSTFSGNSAVEGGAAIYNSDSDPLAANSIFWGDKGGEEIANSGASAPQVSYCVVRNGYSGGTNILDDDPLFVRPPSPGEDDEWGTSDDDYGDLRLLSASPAIDAGDNSLIPADLSDMDGDGDFLEAILFDLGNNLRRFDFPFVSDKGNGLAPLVDMGAFEKGLIYLYLPLVRK